jgi:outer membrane protein OmpA-like peptidoglycan-associated protein
MKTKISIKTVSGYFYSLLLVLSFSFNNSFYGQKNKKDNKENSENEDLSNLVRNGSFEELKDKKKKPKKLGGIDLFEGWSSITVKGDVFITDGETAISVPLNQYGKEDAYIGGKNYAGFHAYCTGKKAKPSYLQGEFISRLEKNKTYCVEFYVSLAEGSKYMCNNLGFAFIDKKLDPENGVLKFKDDKSRIILHPDNKVFSSANGWHKICGTYQAKGKEELFVIGHLSAKDNTKVEAYKKPKNGPKVTALQSAYYYVDNVVVREYYPTFESYLIANNVKDLIKDDSELNEDDLARKDERRKEYEKIPPCTCGGSNEKEDTYSTLTYQKDFIIEENMTPAKKLEVYDVFFAAGKSDISAEAKNTLDEIVRILKANPSLAINITGFSDTVETNESEIKPEYRDIDKKRAEAVSGYLKKNGVSNALNVLWLGIKEESEYVSGDVEEKELDWAKNRRVEFTIK